MEMTDRPAVPVIRIVAAAVTAWLVSIPVGAFMHHQVFGAVYAASAAAYRPDPEIVRRLPIGYVSELIGFLVAATMFARTPRVLESYSTIFTSP